MIGQTISHYQIVEKIGEGGMGQVYKAIDTRLNRRVAIKILPNDKVNDPVRRERFLREARAASALNHPNIVTIYDILSEGGNELLVMEYIAGQTIAEMLAKGPIPMAQALAIGAQIADALATAHEAGIVHRDLKPGNVMFTSGGHVKLLDFGLAKLVQSSPTEDSPSDNATIDASLTQASAIIGTPRYMSPEQAEAKRVDTRSDIFTFGVVLYEMLTGMFAFQAPTTLSTLTAVLRDEPRPLNEIIPEAPEALAYLIGKCIKKDPNDRYQHMRPVFETLKEIASRPQAASATAAASAEPAARVSEETVEWRAAEVSAPAPAPRATSVEPLPAVAPVMAQPAAAAPPRKKSLGPLIAVTALVVAGIGAAFVLPGLRNQPEPQPDAPSPVAETAPPAPAGEPITELAPAPAAPKIDATARKETGAAPKPAAEAPAEHVRPVPAPIAAQPPAPVGTHVDVILKDATPVPLSLSTPIPEDAAKGDEVTFHALADVVVNGFVVIAKGAGAKATIAEAARKRLLGRAPATMLFDSIQTVDGKQARIRETSSSGNRKPRVAGKLDDKLGAVPAGTQYVAYIEGDTAVSAKTR